LSIEKIYVDVQGKDTFSGKDNLRGKIKSSQLKIISTSKIHLSTKQLYLSGFNAYPNWTIQCLPYFEFIGASTFN